MWSGKSSEPGVLQTYFNSILQAMSFYLITFTLSFMLNFDLENKQRMTPWCYLPPLLHPWYPWLLPTHLTDQHRGGREFVVSTAIAHHQTDAHSTLDGPASISGFAAVALLINMIIMIITIVMITDHQTSFHCDGPPNLTSLLPYSHQRHLS